MGSLKFSSVQELRQLNQSLRTIITDAEITESFDRVDVLLKSLLDPASISSVPVHTATAVDCLCGLLDICSASRNVHSRDIALRPSTWNAVFLLYASQTKNFKVKSLRKLLETLIVLLRRQDSPAIRMHLVDDVVHSCVQAILGAKSSLNIKPAIEFLDFSMRYQVCEAHTIISHVYFQDTLLIATKPCQLDGEPQPESLFENAQHLIVRILSWVQYPDCVPAISRFITSFVQSCDSHCIKKDDLRSTHEPIWLHPFKVFLRDNDDLYDVLENQVLTSVLSSRYDDVTSIFADIGMQSSEAALSSDYTNSDIRIHLSTARVALKQNLKARDHERSVGLINTQTFSASFLDHVSSEIRILALDTVILSFVIIQHLTDHTAQRVKECLPYFHQETTPKPRNEFISLAVKFTGSLTKVCAALPPDNSSRSNPADEDPSKNLERLKELQDWYLSFLIRELRPTGNYAGHITALRVLKLCFKQIDLRSLPRDTLWHQSLPNISDMLLELLLDPFDDVRTEASDLVDLLLEFEMVSHRLSPVPLNASAKMVDDIDCNMICRLLDAMPHLRGISQSTGRASHAEGFAHLQRLVFGARRYSSRYCDQDSMYRVTEADATQNVNWAALEFKEAVKTNNLYGNLIALRYITSKGVAARRGSTELSTSFNPTTALAQLCESIWDLVRALLCADAPEGSSLADKTDLDFDQDKEALSFCWRALQESSLLIQAAIERISNGHAWDNTENRKSHARFGQLTFCQLLELRHRGALSTVSKTFAIWCASCVGSNVKELAGMPIGYYRRTIQSFQDKSSILTRRSAGLPSVIAGVLSAVTTHEFFGEVLTSLYQIASQPTRPDAKTKEIHLPQVHALNCLKDIFTDSRFGSQSEAHIATVLTLAFQSLDSHVWAIRNCGLMLMKAVLNRLNGGTDTSSRCVPSSYRRSSDLVYQTYPVLSAIILELLQRCDSDEKLNMNQNFRIQRVFLGLEIVERFGLPRKAAMNVEEALGHLSQDSCWLIRDKAAKTQAANVEEDRVVEHIKSLLMKDWACQNALHSRLLSIKWLLRRYPKLVHKDTGKNLSLFMILEEKMTELFSNNPCPITAAAFLDLICQFFQAAEDSRGLHGAAQMTGLLKYCSSFVESHRDALNDLLFECDTCNMIPAYRCSIQHCVRLFDSILPKTQRENITYPPFTAIPANSELLEIRLEDFGHALGSEYAVNKTPHGWSNKLMIWARSLQLTMHDDPSLLKFREGSHNRNQHSEKQWRASATSVRLAAVQSISNFFQPILAAQGLPRITQDILHSSQFSFHLFMVLMCIYDSMIDDDEDVRYRGAATAMAIVNNSCSIRGDGRVSRFSNPSAKSRFLSFLMQHYGKTIELRSLAIARSLGLTALADWRFFNFVLARTSNTCIDRPQGLISEYEYFDEDLNNAVLFEEEGSNLYVDPYREAQTWVDLYSKLLPPSLQPGSGIFFAIYFEVCKPGLEKVLMQLQDQRWGCRFQQASSPRYFVIVHRIIHAGRMLDEMTRKTNTDLAQFEGFLARLAYMKEKASALKLHCLLKDELREFLYDSEGRLERL